MRLKRLEHPPDKRLVALVVEAVLVGDRMQMHALREILGRLVLPDHAALALEVTHKARAVARQQGGQSGVAQFPPYSCLRQTSRNPNVCPREPGVAPSPPQILNNCGSANAHALPPSLRSPRGSSHHASIHSAALPVRS